MKRLKNVTNNAYILINTWLTFIRAQFSYGISLIREAKHQSTWKKYEGEYYKTLTNMLGVFRQI